MDEIGTFTGRLSGQITTQTPADESNVLLGSTRE
jgi:hypothetical protein